jgi:hypothetical protein
VGNDTFLNSEPTGFTRYIFVDNGAAVPEPVTASLIGLGLAGAAFLRRRTSR